jgi:hypothetical protein
MTKLNCSVCNREVKISSENQSQHIVPKNQYKPKIVLTSRKGECGHYFCLNGDGEHVGMFTGAPKYNDYLLIIRSLES